MSDECRVPEWEEYPHTPGVFVRVANKGLAVYVSWKNVRKMGDDATAKVKRCRDELKSAQCKKRKALGLKKVPLGFL
jgi:hypothetical protein